MDSSDSPFSTTPANLLAASMAANPFSHLFFQGQVEGQDYKFQSRCAYYHCKTPLRGIFLVVEHVVGFKEKSCLSRTPPVLYLFVKKTYSIFYMLHDNNLESILFLHLHVETFIQNITEVVPLKDITLSCQ